MPSGRGMRTLPLGCCGRAALEKKIASCHMKAQWCSGSQSSVLALRVLVVLLTANIKWL